MNFKSILFCKNVLNGFVIGLILYKNIDFYTRHYSITHHEAV